ncbi:hypothetical protein COLO4_27768 [Corchorus olitorius]|uniref:Uncharacterized protein n=1 Tax=Corchorus olitorius TaxID=93759 RepID=A0A1R3HPA4_9ROSI|nr:hypothetical protein COLO4_27768 [Corchorus olitorius]
MIRMRFCSATPQSQRTSQALDSPPLYMNCFELEMQSYQQRPNSANLGKTIMSLTFQVVVALALSMGQSHHQLLSIQIVKVSMIMAFAASFSGIFLRNSYPKSARIVENTGSIAAAVGFFIMTSIFLPVKFSWVAWLACVSAAESETKKSEAAAAASNEAASVHQIQDACTRDRDCLSAKGCARCKIKNCINGVCFCTDCGTN